MELSAPAWSFTPPRDSVAFLPHDTWQGDPMQPMGYNLWLYVYDNPAMYVDPSGELPLAEGESPNLYKRPEYPTKVIKVLKDLPSFVPPCNIFTLPHNDDQPENPLYPLYYDTLTLTAQGLIKLVFGLEGGM